MKTLRALVIESDPKCVAMIDEVLAAIGHEYQVADCLLEARRLIQAGQYDYVLLGAMLPTRAGGTPLVSNAHRALSELAQARNGTMEPVIVLLPPEDGYPEPTKRAAVRMAHGFMSRGAADFIDQPFPRAGRTLDRVIEKVLGLHDDSFIGPVRPKRSASRQSADSGDASDWLTVTAAAELLMHDVPSLDLAKARSRISAAAGRKDFTFAGSRMHRRIEPHTFASWRLHQRDRDLDEEDENDTA